MTAPPLRRHEEMGRRQSVDRQDARCALFPCRVGGEQSRGPRGRTAYRRRSDPGRPLSRQHTGSDTGKELPEEPSLRGGPTPHCVLRNAHCAPPDQKSHARSDDRHGPPADAAIRTDLGIPRSRTAVEAHPGSGSSWSSTSAVQASTQWVSSGGRGNSTWLITLSGPKKGHGQSCSLNIRTTTGAGISGVLRRSSSAWDNCPPTRRQRLAP